MSNQDGICINCGQSSVDSLVAQLRERDGQYMDAAKKYVEKEGPEAAIRRGVRVWDVALWWRRERDEAWEKKPHGCCSGSPLEGHGS